MQKRGRIRNRAVIVARDTFAFQKSMANEQESPEVLRAPLALSKNGSIQADPIDPGYLLHCGLGAVGLAVARAECRVSTPGGWCSGGDFTRWKQLGSSTFSVGQRRLHRSGASNLRVGPV